MAAPEPGVPLPRILSALHTRVSATSLRSVAEEVGLSHRGLSKLLEGTRPQGRTLEKLDRWYRHHAASRGAGYSTVQTLDLLLAGVPDDYRAEARQAVARCIVRICREIGCTPAVEIVEVAGEPE